MIVDCNEWSRVAERTHGGTGVRQRRALSARVNCDLVLYVSGIPVDIFGCEGSVVFTVFTNLLYIRSLNGEFIEWTLK